MPLRSRLTFPPRRPSRLLFRAVLAILAAFVVYLVVLYGIIVGKFESHRWNIPSRVYSDAFYLVPGKPVAAKELEAALTRRGYRKAARKVEGAGEYLRGRSSFTIGLHAFDYPWERFPGGRLRIELAQDAIAKIVDDSTGESLASARLEPETVAALFDEKREDRTLVTLEEVPGHLIDAVLAVEDERFWHHLGVDPLAILRALLANVLHRKVVQGGSTLTQQLVKNFFLSSERTLTRKFHELWMALILEARYSKREILNAYLNEIYFGSRGPSSVAGVGEAARFYFSKEVGQLTLDEAALLAGLIRAPGLYNPFRKPERALQRRNSVLARLRDLKKIEASDYERAIQKPLLLPPSPSPPSGALFFVDAITHEIRETLPKEKLVREGLRIFTTLDARMQEAAEEALSAGILRLEKNFPAVREGVKGGSRLEGALIALSPQNGYIRALVGGRDFRTSQFNRATTAMRQPGSCFKPFVYLAALETDDGRSWTPASLIEDAPFEVSTAEGPWSPKNYDEAFHGWVTLQAALENSYNVATAKLALLVGPSSVAAMAQRLGISSPLEAVPSLALGALEVTPLELARAFAGIASGGFRVDPLGLLQVVTPEGEVIEKKSVGLRRAASPESTFILISILEGVLDRGTARLARTLGFKGIAAGKTGTTTDWRDSWFVGFTPSLVALVWVGFDDGTPTHLSGASGALPIWVDFMKRIGLAGSPDEFPMPQGIIVEEVDPSSGGLARKGCPRRVKMAFREGSPPLDPCTLH